MRTTTSRGSRSAGRDVPALERARPEVLDDDVGRRGEPAEQVLALGRAQVERDALAAAALDRPEQRVRRRRRRSTNGPISRMKSPVPRLLDLDDLGAHLAEQPGAEGRGDAGAEIEHAQPVERSGHRSRPCSRFTASMPPSLRGLDPVERGRRVAHELVDHEVVAPRLALALPSSMWLIDSLIASAVTAGTSATLSAISRAAAASSARGTTRLTSP